MSFLAQYIGALTPAPVDITPDYDGLEFKWKFITFRPALFKNEIYFLAVTLFYVAFWYIGKSSNEARARKWLGTHLPLLRAQFSKPTHTDDLSSDGYTDFFVYSTGRRAISSLHTTFRLRPRHDLIQYLFQFFRGLVELDYSVVDELELEFTFKEDTPVPECVWAVVSKDEMKRIRNNRWDLTFAKTTENPALPPSLTVMSELADVTTTLFKPYGTLSLPAVLSSPAILPYFRSLSLTDQPRVRPGHVLPPSERRKRLILSLALPPASDAAATLPLLAAAFALVDVVAGEGRLPGARGGLASHLRPETRTKLRKTREEVDKEIREEATREKREEEEEQRAAARAKAHEEKVSKLSAAEQKKVLEREKKRMLRKTQGKVKAR